MGSVNINNPNHSDHRGRTIHPLQPAYINTAFPLYQLADSKFLSTPTDHQVLLSIKHTPDSTAESCIITHDMPHCGAVITFTWAALAMHPDAIFSNANSSTAIDWRAMSGHAFPINGGTTPPLLKLQEAAPLPTIGSRHIAATHSSKEASCPPAPPQALLLTSMPLLLRPQTMTPQSCSSAITHLTHQTCWVIKNATCPVPAPQTTQWLTHPHPCFPP